MAEFTAVAAQTLQPGANVQWTETPVEACAAINHRAGSGLVVLRGLTTTQCRARFRVFFSGNLAVPAGAAVGSTQVSITIDGEPIQSTTMIVTPAATDEYFNVSSAVFIDVPKGCCLTVAVENTDTEVVSVANANLIVERVA